MAILARSGVSIRKNANRAVDDALDKALGDWAPNDIDLVLVFCTTGYELEAVVQRVHERTGGRPMAGGSAEGVVTYGESIEGAFAIEISVIKAEGVAFHPVVAHGLGENSDTAGEDLGRAFSALAPQGAAGIMLLPDGLTLNFDEIRDGIERTYQPGTFVPMFGGLTSENWTFTKTYQICNGEVYSDSIVGVLIEGTVDLLFAVNHGCEPVGQQLTVTKSDKNVILEIDGKPALDKMQEYFDIRTDESWSKATNNLTIAFRAEGEVKSVDEYVVRYMPSRDVEQRSFAIATTVEPGTPIWLARRDHDKLENGVRRLVENMNAQLNGRKPAFFLHFDCAGRGTAIFTEKEKNDLLQTLHDGIDGSVPWLGFHCFGEIGPVGTHNYFHNYTAVLVGVVDKGP